MRKNIYYYNTPIGKICLAERSGKLTNVFFGDEKQEGNIFESEIIKRASSQLMRYFEGNQKVFDIPLEPSGTEYMNKVYAALQKIPYGETCTYKEIAKITGNEKACRAVGNANNKNTLPIFIPCHRVIGSNGRLTGYRGGVDIKQKLLDLESKYKHCECY